MLSHSYETRKQMRFIATYKWILSCINEISQKQRVLRESNYMREFL